MASLLLFIQSLVMSDQNPLRRKRPRSATSSDNNTQDDTTAGTTTAYEKVGQIAKLLHEWHWGFNTLVRHWFAYKDGQQGLRRARKKVELLRELLIDDAETTYKELETHDLLVESMVMASTFLVNGIRNELSTLRDSLIFGKWDHSIDFKNINLCKAVDEIQTLAPIFTRLITELGQNKRSVEYTRQENTGYVVMIASILLLKSSRNSANTFARMLGLYLQGSGVKRRAISVLHGLGIIEGYSALNHSKRAISIRSEVKFFSLNHTS